MTRLSALSCVVVLAAALAAAVVVVDATPSPVGYTFEQWLSEFGPRGYDAGTPQYATRRAIFEGRAKEVEAHNANRGNTYTRTMRHRWADMTLAETRAVSHGGGAYHGPASPYRRAYDASGDVDVADLPTAMDYRNAGVVSAVKDQGNCG